MKLSTRTRYGVRLMAALARRYGQGPQYLKDIARGENISEKYLSLIMIPLRGARLVSSIRGAHGGYSLARPPEDITLREIVQVFEGDCLVDCVKAPELCDRVPICASRELWGMLGDKIAGFLEGVTLKDLVLMNRDKMEAVGPEAMYI